jgi:hypothetical protein
MKVVDYLSARHQASSARALNRGLEAAATDAERIIR